MAASKLFRNLNHDVMVLSNMTTESACYEKLVFFTFSKIRLRAWIKPKSSVFWKSTPICAKLYHTSVIIDFGNQEHLRLAPLPPSPSKISNHVIGINNKDFMPAEASIQKMSVPELAFCLGSQHFKGTNLESIPE